MCVHIFLGACLCTISSHHPIGSTVQCAFSPFGNTASAGLVAIPRNTNLSALENIWSNVSGICSLGICSITSNEMTPSKVPSGKF